MCVKRLVYTNDAGEEVKGVCSNFLCKDAKLSMFSGTCFITYSSGIDIHDKATVLISSDPLNLPISHKMCKGVSLKRYCKTSINETYGIGFTSNPIYGEQNVG